VIWLPLAHSWPISLQGDSTTDLDLSRPRTIGEVLGIALRLYARQAPLFIFLAGIVVVPYEVVVIAISDGKHVTVGTDLVLAIVNLALVDPCIAALLVHAVLKLGDGQRPPVAEVIRRGLTVLPVVAAAEIVAGLGEVLGFIFFIIPGLFLAVRWAVVAQAAAVERTNWPTALRRSFELTHLNFWRVLGLLAIANILNDIAAAIIGTGESPGPTIAGIVIAIIVHSFGTLLLTLLYFDLHAREALALR
jgi:hypothetical protein